MPHGIVPRGLGRDVKLFCQAPQRTCFRRSEIANAMLVVDRKRLIGFARGARRTRRRVEQAAPAAGCFFVLASPSQHHGEHPERGNSYQRY